MRIWISILIMALMLPAWSAGLDPANVRMVDLTHPLNEETLYWPTSPSAFELEELAHGHTEGGWFYSANRFCTPEHGGTHLDAPIHFAEGMHTTDQVPLERLVGPAVVIDVNEQAAEDRDYRLTLADVEAFEAAHGRIAEGSMVLLHTGFSRYWPDRKTYFGDDMPGDASNLSFPGFGEDATRFLIEQRGAILLGIDTASIDYGRSTDFIVHRVAARANVPALENLTRLDQLPPTGALVIALPIKIEGGSGGPARVIALIKD